ncbi:hypothetical protein [uncultured Methanolobus sp.]|uniref:hypothetical protein n=1 Tax=uncultured Methanolobus sp. TaxID=218300 RepID=UPI0029C97F97|nr:hypothetical protein [uncultured Methanolobus sp.]
MPQNDDFLESFQFPPFISKTHDAKNEDYAHICFIRRYRDHNKNTKYVFKSPEINAENVSNEFLKWLRNSYTRIDFDNICKYNAGVPQETHEWILLNNISSWTYFLNPIAHNFDREIGQSELDKMRNDLAGIMIFCNKDGCTYGQITRLKPKVVLNNSEGYLAIFDSNENNYISTLQNEKGFRITSHSDILFNINSEGVARAVVFSKNEFEEIFDLNEELKQNAINVLHEIKLFEENPDFEDIVSFVKDDRTIQKMLNNRVFLEKQVQYLTWPELKKLKEIAPEILLFDISEDGKSFILPNNENKGRALRQIIKAISRRYIVGDNDKIFMENAGITESWKLSQFEEDMKEEISVESTEEIVLANS